MMYVVDHPAALVKVSRLGYGYRLLRLVKVIAIDIEIRVLNLPTSTYE
jgi:hypothetical protein